MIFSENQLPVCRIMPYAAGLSIALRGEKRF
jgi:hypothetical protein